MSTNLRQPLTREKGLVLKFMKFSSISFFISVRENFSGRSSFSGNPLNFGHFSVLGTLLNGENDVSTLAFISSILTAIGAIGFWGSVLGLIWGSCAGFSECRLEYQDAREEMMEKKTLA
ncbi:hypothetical protein V8G54_034875 [Vigna mungo]|uniref:Uncharacterized protein n=1 Tax=Vigna mungo TaxID=3915 RepID=A0AAQ3MDY3_VIGMU